MIGGTSGRFEGGNSRGGATANINTLMIIAIKNWVTIQQKLASYLALTFDIESPSPDLVQSHRYFIHSYHLTHTLSLSFTGNMQQS